MIDLQINGGFGHHFGADPLSIWEVGERLAELGVTGFVPTLTSNDFERMSEALDALGQEPAGYGGATPLGWHLEGPWLNPRRAGAHDPAALADVPLDLTYQLRPSNGVRIVTIAPELPGALDAITELSSRGVVVSLGHSDATYDEAMLGFDAGAAMVTHLFNAMSGLHHRHPGLAAAALHHPDITLTIIADGHHVAPPMVHHAWQWARSRLVLVSDAVASWGTNDDLVARLPNGTIAGGATALPDCVANLRKWTRCSEQEALHTVIERPRALGLA